MFTISLWLNITSDIRGLLNRPIIVLFLLVVKLIFISLSNGDLRSFSFLTIELWIGSCDRSSIYACRKVL